MKTQDELIEKLKKLERAEADWKLFKEEEEDLQQDLSNYLKKKSEVAASIEELKASFLQSLQELETKKGEVQETLEAAESEEVAAECADILEELESVVDGLVEANKRIATMSLQELLNQGHAPLVTLIMSGNTNRAENVASALWVGMIKGMLLQERLQRRERSTTAVSDLAVLEALKLTKKSWKEAASELGIKPKALRYRIKKIAERLGASEEEVMGRSAAD